MVASTIDVRVFGIRGAKIDLDKKKSVNIEHGSSDATVCHMGPGQGCFLTMGELLVM